MRSYELKLNGKDFSVNLCSLSSEEAILEINGKEYNIEISSVSEMIPEGVLPDLAPRSVVSPVSSVKKAASGDGSVLAPIPGSIIKTYVKVGDKVKAGQPLFKMEAMKMENEINARIDGTIASVSISAGDTVSQGDELMVITP